MNRDLYVPPWDIGFWQAAFRDEADPQYDDACKAVNSRRQLTADILHGGADGSPRVVTRFGLQPAGDDGWLISVNRHWNIDRADPQ